MAATPRAKSVIDNRDFQMLAPLVRVTGAGLVPMPPRTVDYGVEAKLVATTKGQGGDDSLTGLPIPIKVTGSWDEPSYSVDWASVFKAAALDPSRLESMSPDLRGMAEGFGVALPGLSRGAEGGGIGGLLKSLPGLSSSTVTAAPEAEAPTESSGGLGDLLKQVIKPSEPETTEEAPNPIKMLKGLFGGD